MTDIIASLYTFPFLSSNSLSISAKDLPKTFIGPILGTNRTPVGSIITKLSIFSTDHSFEIDSSNNPLVILILNLSPGPRKYVSGSTGCSRANGTTPYSLYNIGVLDSSICGSSSDC